MFLKKENKKENNMTPEEKREVQKMVDEAIRKSLDFSTRKLGDTPTDDFQLTPKKYVNLNGTRANRPSVVSAGQQYFSTQDNYPWFTDGKSSWFSATGSIVAAL